MGNRLKRDHNHQINQSMGMTKLVDCVIDFDWLID